MIASVCGDVLELGPDYVVVEAGGVGYRINATPATVATLVRGGRTRLFTAQVVREDSLTLYGFADTQARDLFQLLQTVSGVGPRLALAVLAVLDPDALRKALANSDIQALTRVPGVGRRGAERMVVELRDKVDVVPVTAGLPGAQPAQVSTASQVSEALQGLGFRIDDAESAVTAVLAEQPDANTAQALRAALGRLGRNT